MSENTSESKPTTPPSPNAFFQWMRDLGITREPGWLGGVAAGVAVRLGIDPIIVRGIFVVVALLGAPALLLYAAAWLLLPDLDGRIHLERLVRGHFDGAVIGIGVLVILAFVPFTQGIWFWGPWNWDVWGGGRFIGGALWNLLWTLAIVGSIVWLIVWLATRRGASRTPYDSVLYTASTATDATTSASGSTGASAAFVSPATDAPVPPPATPPTDPDGLAEWKEQQAAWKREHAAWKAHQATSAQERAAQERRLRAEQSAAQRTALAEEYRRTHPHPLFSLIMIGVALVAGAISALLVVGTGTWTHTATQVGLAVALGVLGLAVVINGLLGKRQGGAGGFAWLVAFALVISTLGGLGGIGGFSITGERNWRPSYQLDHSVTETHISGNVDLNLTDYFDAADADSDDPDGRVTLRVISGNVNVIVPANAHTFLHVSIVSGTITSDQESGSRRLSATDLEYTPLVAGSDNPELRVNVWVVSGNVTVTQAKR